MKLLVANWKMNLDLRSGVKLASEIADFVDSNHVKNKIIVCPPFTMLDRVGNVIRDKKISLGAQDCFHQEKGPYTGSISPAMLRDCGCDYVILGHSEPRLYYNEPLDIIQKKAHAAHKYGMTTIICIGESEQERCSGATFRVLEEQLMNFIPSTANSYNTIIAYEPIWAIGSGESPTNDQIEEVSKFVQKVCASNFPFENQTIMLYGGSVSTRNCRDVLSSEYLSGLLIGGASLVYNDFTQIIKSTL